MRKKFYALLASLMLVALSVPAWAAYYELAASEDSYVSGPEIYVASGDVYDPESGYTEGNYTARYRLPDVALTYTYENADEEEITMLIPSSNYSLSWDVIFTSSDVISLDYKLGEDASSDIMTLYGLLPETSGDYTFYIQARVASVVSGKNLDGAVGMETSFDTPLTLTVDNLGYTTILASGDTSFDLCVTAGSNLYTATKSYDIEVTALKETLNPGTPAEREEFTNYIYYNETDEKIMVDLPYWLSFDALISEDEDTGNILVYSVDIFFEPSADVEEGTKGVVRVPFKDTDDNSTFMLSWNVTYSASDDKKEDTPITIDVASIDFSLDEDSTPTAARTLSYTGSAPVSCTLSSALPTGLSLSVSSTDSTITLTASATTSAAAGTISRDITFTDANGNTDSVDVYITYTKSLPPVPTGDFVLISTVNPVIVSNDSTAKSVTLTASGDISGTLTWTIGTTPTGIYAAQTSTSSKSATFSVSADTTATVGNNSLTITASDDAHAHAAALTITVQSGDTIATYFEIITATTSPISLVQGDTTSSITYNVTGTLSGDLTWSVATSASDLTSTVTTSSDAGMTFTLTASSSAASGDRTVTVTANDKANTQTATLTVRVLSSDSGGDTTSSKVYSEISDTVLASLVNNIEAILTSMDVDADLAKLSSTDFSSTERSVSDVKESFAYERIVLALPLVSVDATNIYAFAISYDVLASKIGAGNYMYVHVTSYDEESSTVGNTTSAMFVNNSGNFINRVPSSSSNGVNVLAYLTANTTYSIVISTYAPPTPPVSQFSIASSGTLPTSLVHGNTTSPITYNVSGTPSGDITWQVATSSGDLTATITSRSNTSMTFTLTAASSALGQRSVWVEARDSRAGVTASFSINITSGSQPDVDPTPDYGNTSARPRATDPAVVNNQNVRNTVSRLSNGSDVAALDLSRFSSTARTVQNITEAMPLNETPRLVFPLISNVSESKIYMFSVSFDNLVSVIPSGNPVFVHVTPVVVSGSATIAAQINAGDNAMLVDNNGSEIISVPANGNNGVNIAAYLVPNTTYSPVISTTSGEVLGPSNAGCNIAGVGSLVLALLGFAIAKKKS